VKAHEEYADYCKSTGVLRDMKLAEARTQTGATSWESLQEMHQISRALVADTDLRAVLASSLRGPGASALGVKQRALVEARPAPAKRPEPAHDKKVAALEARVQKLETLLEQLLAEKTPVNEDEAPVEPHVTWIENNRETLRAHADSFIALDPAHGIVVHASEGEDFEAQLGALSAKQRASVVLFHASMYV
jgi:hypothetical protein